MESQDWNHVITVDETTIRLNSSPRMSWQKSETTRRQINNKNLP